MIEDLFDVLPVNVENLVDRIVEIGCLNDFEKLTRMLALFQFGEIVLGKTHNEGGIREWKSKCLNKDDFVKVIRGGCSYMNVYPDKELLFSLYDQINRNGEHVSYRDYRDFVGKLFGTSEGDSYLIK